MKGKTAKNEGSKVANGSFYFDYTFLFAVLFLLGFGLIMIYSVSYYQAQADYGDKAYFLTKQAIAVGLGIVAMIITSIIPYSFWRKFAGAGYLLSFILVVLVPFIGVESHGAKRWLEIPGIGMTFQPAEVAKLCVILLMADVICKVGKNINRFFSVLTLLLISIFMGGLVWLLTDNLSSGIIIAGIGIFMFFVASPNYKVFIGVAIAGGIAVSGFLYYLSQLEMAATDTHITSESCSWVIPFSLRKVRIVSPII